MFLDQWLDSHDYIVAHTSGSTGAPKPIRLKKSDMRLSAEATCRHFAIGGESLLVLPLSEDYIAGKMMIVRARVSGARLIVELPCRTPLAEPISAPVDLVAIVPQQIEGLLASPCVVRNAIVGGAPVSPELERQAVERRPDISWWATYGMTETCSHVALRRFGQPLFEALPGIRFSIDSRGCLVITNDRASWSPVVTNDVVELTDDRHFRWLGRADNVIISGGLKLHPELIERKIADIMGGRRYFIVGTPSAQWGSEAVMVVEGVVDTTLQAKVEARLSGPERPKRILFVDELPTTGSGKILRKIP